VTAPTAIAAVNVGGQTIHSFAGFGMGTEPVDKIMEKLSGKAKARWKSCKVLLIDEVSMLSGSLFDKLNAMAKAVMHNCLPFGGIQVVCCGDFYQLPPVNMREKYAFESSAWGSVLSTCIVLHEIYRQKDVNLQQVM
jgi:ATP-dependent DNA helicase PIF1